eukprot:m.222602 g.222602  ORF g.222602 m.222602 type:complete len:947 (-) comp16065_c0_seq1:230-3070(-)
MAIEWSARLVRAKYIDFFRSKGHVFWPSSKVIPYEDPTLLFTNAGMNQFKPIFLGTADPKSELAKLTRAANSQKCIRAGGKHNDLDDVGKDVYHHTFFEMLGNWSFGNYFKQEAIEWAWELLVNEYKIDPNRLYATYFMGNEAEGVPADEEAKAIWLTKLPASRVLPYGKKENFWEMGETGPCGPCTEIHYDRIGGRDAAALVNADDPDVLEIWNLVFIQYNRDPNGLRKLPANHVDTGMGLERVTSVLQNKRSNYDTDLFSPIFTAIQSRVPGLRDYTGKVGAEDVDGFDTAYRVLADHIRTLTIAISDGGMPDSVGRGYVLRLILRRAIRFSKKINAPPNLMSGLVPVVVELLGDFFTDLGAHAAHVQEVLDREEALFRRTLDRGERIFQSEASGLQKGGVFAGDVAWKLYDTYGFPIDLTKVMAEERGLKVDLAGYEAAKQLAREVSANTEARKEEVTLTVHQISHLSEQHVPATEDSAKFNYDVAADGSYVFHNTTARVVALVADGAFVDAVSTAGPAQVGVVLDRTNFYAEMGGQVADTGLLLNDATDTDFVVQNVKKCGPFALHIGVLQSGALKVGDELTLNYHSERRRAIMSNHTATHLLNFALREVLKETEQDGSLVDPEKLRFDVRQGKQINVAELEKIEAIVQSAISKKLGVYSQEATLEAAKPIVGLRTLAGEAYPNPVRVVSVGTEVSYLLANPTGPESLQSSVEFCGGTHVKNSGDIGSFLIMRETAISAGSRRIIAVTGLEADKANQLADTVEAKVNALGENCQRSEILALRDQLLALPSVRQARLRTALDVKERALIESEKKAQAERAAAAIEAVKKLVESKPGPFVVQVLNCGSSSKALNSALTVFKTDLPDSAALFIGHDEASVSCIASVPKGLVAKGLKANEWISQVTALLNAKGGGRDETAQCSGTAVDKVGEVVELAKQFASTKLQ